MLSMKNELEICVLYLTDSGVVPQFDPGFGQDIKWDIELLDGYTSRIFQPGQSINKKSFWERYDSGMEKAVIEIDPDAILLYGYSSRMNWSALKIAKQRGIKVFYNSDSNARLQRPYAFLKSGLKRIALGYFFKRVDVFLSPSAANREYLNCFGVPNSKIHWLPFAIDVNRFRNIGNDGERKFSFIWAGKFIPLKRLSDYLTALEILRSEQWKFKALLVGSGPEGEKFSKQINSLVQSGHLESIGFVNQSEMPGLLASADVLVFTSERDQYGLIATEASAAGCGLIVADSIGCVGFPGVAQSGYNALIYDVGNVSKLTKYMRKCLIESKLVRELQNASQDIAAAHDISCAANIINELVLENCTGFGNSAY